MPVGVYIYIYIYREKARSIIVKFKSWGLRTAFYKACLRKFMNGRKKPGAKNFSVSLNLTKRRYFVI